MYAIYLRVNSGRFVAQTMFKKIKSIMNKMIDNVLNREKVNIKEGRWKEFNKHAVLIAVGCYVQDRKHGPWKEYYDTGEIMLEEHYDEGVCHGRYTAYHPNGRLASEGMYVHGSREGYFKIYDESGKHYKSLLFVNNNLVEEVKLAIL
jgi:antitoxin component YwqK of YwqJK toxin-antitoxin module